MRYKKDIISVWLCIDDPSCASYFPSSSGYSTSPRVQNIYWRCTMSFFYLARFFNPDKRLILFTNLDTLPVVEGTDVDAMLKKLSVEIITVPFLYMPPDGWYNGWRNQFYIFSIMDHISKSPSFDEDDVFLNVDSDCLITGDLTLMFDLVRKEKCINYALDIPEDYVINGNSRRLMREIFAKLEGGPVDIVPIYFGGEFVMATIGTIKKMYADFIPTWSKSLGYHERSLPHFCEEAHMLSYLYYKHNFYSGQANQFIKRMWTDPNHSRNVEAGDEKLLIWHMPSEKRFGFKRFYNLIKSKEFSLSAFSAEKLIAKMKQYFGVPSMTLRKSLIFSIRYMGNRILNLKNFAKKAANY